jgi:hypothetical protein
MGPPAPLGAVAPARALPLLARSDRDSPPGKVLTKSSESDGIRRRYLHSYAVILRHTTTPGANSQPAALGGYYISRVLAHIAVFRRTLHPLYTHYTPTTHPLSVCDMAHWQLSPGERAQRRARWRCSEGNQPFPYGREVRPCYPLIPVYMWC